MHSFNVFIPLAFAAAANAVEFTNANFDVVASRPFTITWSGNTSPVTIFLKGGDPSNLKTLNTVVSGATGNSFVWIPSGALPNNVYTLEIEDDGQNNPNYSPQFQYVGGVPALPTTTSSATSMSMSSSTTSMASSTTATTASSETTPMTSSETAPMTGSETASSTESSATQVSSNSTMTQSSSATRSSATSTKHESTASRTSATGSRTSESAAATKTGDTSGAGQVANPIALIVFTVGALAFFN